MNYVYPKLSAHDLGVVRLGGAGLGNILFAWARAAVFARDSGCEMIWPTWPSIKLGPWLRREPDKRFYGDLFQNRQGAIGGFRKLRLLASCSRLREEQRENIRLEDETIVEFTGFEGCFESLLYEYRYIYHLITSNLKEKNRVPLEDAFGREASHSIGVHIRLGDFGRVSEKEVRGGRHDSALPLSWYVQIIGEIRRFAGEDLPVCVFSDGSEEELEPVLSLPGVKRLSFGTSIADILALSRFPLLVASGSSFSMWARYLGRANCICYVNQRKQKLLTPEEDRFEIETDGIIDEETGRQIAKLYRKSERADSKETAIPNRTE